MSVADTAVGAILEIPPALLNDIQKAQRYIENLQITSQKAASAVSEHWGKIATGGLDTFIQKLADAQNVIKGMNGGTVNFNLNTENATQQMSNFTEKVKSDSSKISQSIQEIATIPMDVRSAKEFAETWNMTFQDVQDKIKALRNGLKEMNTESPASQTQLQAIKAWEDYYKSVSKVNEEKDKMSRKTADIERAISNVKAQIDHESQAWERSKTKIDEAQKAIDQFKQTNPTFNWRDATLELDRLKEKYNELYEKFKTAPTSDLSGIRQQMDATLTSFESLDKQLLEYERLLQRKRDAEENASGDSYQKSIAKLQERYDSLTRDLEKARSAQALFNSELEKGNTAKSLASEYAKLTKRLQEVNDAMNKFQSSGGNINSTAYKSLENEIVAILARRKEIEKMNIAEVNQYRQQMNQSAYQQDLSAWVQNETQKTAEAKKQTDERARQQAEAQQKYLNSAQGAMWYSRQLNKGNIDNSYENRERAIKQLESAIKSLDKNNKDYDKTLEKLTRTLNNLKNAQNEVNNAMKPTKPMVSPQDAINAAKNATTLKQLQDAYKQLQEVMNHTDPKSQQWQAMNSQLKLTEEQIKKIEKEMGKFQSQSKQTSGVIGQLQGRIAAAFSVGAITGFIKKMVEVRAQFELQRVALGAIIQDRDEANKIFTQVQNMALESPFNIMQLEKATKQIAAFGFETQKLVPTMKMFADISAGLGVEIDRLVLVMGHLKARGFLEGTMTRQFTNMGFNVLGELSKYYSELENKMVSVGEVQDRVKKKMVSFADVEEVLKRVTSAGGMFYDMQKKQSDSLWGQLQRIQDAYDLMLNSIGQSNEGILKSALTTIRSLINHWRILAPIVSTVGGMMATAMAVKAVQFMVNGIKQLNVALAATAVRLKLVADAQRFAQMSTAIGAVVTVLMTLALAIKGVIDEQKALNEELNRIGNEGIGNMYDLIFQYRRLADTVRDTNSTYEERQKALEEIHRIYKDILPDQMLEIDNIRKMKDGYEEATQAIQAYYAEKIKTQQKEAIDESFGKDIINNITSISNTMANVLVKNKNVTGDASKKAVQAAVRNVLSVVTEEIKSGKTDADKLHERFIELLASTFGVSSSDLQNLTTEIKNTQGQVIGFTRVSLENYLVGLDDIYGKIEDKYGEISSVGLAGITFASEQERKESAEYVDRYNALEKAVDGYKKALQGLREEQEKGNVGELRNDNGTLSSDEVKGLGQSALDNVNQSAVALKNTMRELDGDFTITMEDINEALQSNVDMAIYFEDVNDKTFGKVLNNYQTWGKEVKGNNFFVNFIERMNDKLREMNLTDEQKQIRNLIKEVGELNNVDLSKYKWALIESKDNVTSVAKEVKSEVESLKNSIKKYKTAVAAGLPAIIAQVFFLGGKTLEEVQQTMKAVDELSHKLGNADKASKGKGSDKELKRWQDLKKAIEEVSTAYDKYRKSFTVEESNKRIEELYGPAFEELGSNIRKFYKDGKYDAKGLIDALEVLKGITKDNTEERKKFRSEIERKIGVTNVEIEVKASEESEKKLQKDLDKMFASYELTEELKKIGVSVDLTYMVGGKPTTLDDIRKEIARLRAEGGDSADAENRIKILEDAENKITQMELKAQKERLKNYQKYLTKSYSDSAKIQLDYYTKLTQMQEDFAKAEKDLREQLQDPNVSADDKLKIQQALENLPNQASRASKKMREEMEKELDKLNLDKLLKSPLFAEMFQDLGSMTNKVLDSMLDKIRDIQNSANDLSLSEVRRLSQYAEKIENAKLDNSPFKEAYNAIKKAYELRSKGITAKGASDALAVSEAELERLQTLKDDISFILGLKEKSYAIDGQSVNVGGEQIELTEQQLSLLNQSTAELNEQGNALDNSIKKQKQVVTANARNVQVFKNAKTATEKFGAALQEVAKLGIEAMNAIKAGLQVFGKEIGEEDEVWLDFVGNMLSTCITLGIAFVALGIEINSALGIIGLIAIALSVVSQLFTAIFQAHDKRLEKQISNVQKGVDKLERAFSKLKDSIDNAFKALELKSDSQKAIQNLNRQKEAYMEMIRLEEEKKKTDNDKVDEYREKIEDINDAIKELQETIIEKWGGFGSKSNFASATEAFASAWLDAYKEVGDGLDALGEQWDEYIDNLIKKQIALRYVGPRMEQFMKLVDQYVSKGSDQDEYLTRQELDKLRELKESLLGGLNTELKDVMDYLGYSGGKGELILSDLQKGIQNITEPQAAAIEAYLNSMRFAVFRHTEQLDTLIATIQMQYGSGAENPVVTELKGIRGVLDNIDRRLASVINTQGRNATLRIGAN